MGNLTLLVVGIMIVPAVIGGIIFAMHDRSGNPYPQIESYDLGYVEPTWPEGYVFEGRGGNFAWDAGSVLDKMYRKLEKVDKTNLSSRKRNELDDWFDSHISVFCKHSEFLAYIAIYGNLTSRFIAGLKDPEHNVELQKNLVSLVHNSIFDTYRPNCINLLWDYLGKWDLTDEIKETITTDPRFTYIANMYHRRRDNAS
jgi:hypothetical protein